MSASKKVKKSNVKALYKYREHFHLKGGPAVSVYQNIIKRSKRFGSDKVVTIKSMCLMDNKQIATLTKDEIRNL